MYKSFRLSRRWVVQKVKFRASFSKKKLFLYLTKIILFTTITSCLIPVPHSSCCHKCNTECCLTKNQNAPRPSEHPPVRGGNVKTFRWDHRLQIQTTSSWHLNGFPYGSNIGSTTYVYPFWVVSL